jgi:hypothetical protein
MGSGERAVSFCEGYEKITTRANQILQDKEREGCCSLSNYLTIAGRWQWFVTGKYRILSAEILGHLINSFGIFKFGSKATQ